MYVLCGELWSAALGGPRVSVCACSVTNNDIVVARFIYAPTVSVC